MSQVSVGQRFGRIAVLGASVMAAGVVLVGCGNVALDVAPPASSAPAVSCATGGGAANTCVVGDTGPGGGKVFYVNESERNLVGAPTPRYIEAAPPTWNGGSSDPVLKWCDKTTTQIAGTFGESIGDGKPNTDNMVAPGACTSGAAKTVRAYGTPGAPAGSWSLPAIYEMSALANSGVGELTTMNYYLSSTQMANLPTYVMIWPVGFDGGTGFDGIGYKSTANPVRPIHEF